MDTKMRIFVADMNAEVGRNLAMLVKNREDMQVIGYAKDGPSAYSMIKDQHPDVVITDLILPGMDGLDLMSEVNKDDSIEQKPYFVVLSAISVPSMIESACMLGASYYFLKPCGAKQVVEKLSMLSDNLAAHDIGGGAMNENDLLHVERKDMEYQVTEVLREAGIPPHIKGYQYLRDGILMVMDESDLLNGVTKVLYPEIAKHYKTTASSVERAMRHAIEVAWNRGSLEYLNILFGSHVQDCLSKPTNSEFIALIADELRLKEKHVYHLG